MQPTVWCSQVLASPSAKKVARLVLLTLTILFISDAAFAVALDTILGNLRSIIVPMTAMVLMISFAAGIFMVIKGLTMFKKFGASLSQQTQPGEFSGPLIYIVVGAVLIYLPTSTNVMMSSIFQTSESIFGSGSVNYQNLGQGSSLLGYVSGGTLEQQWGDLANTLVLYIQFLGFLSFVKGWFLVAKGGQHGGGQQGGMGKGFVHIIGGIIAINFINVVTIIKNTVYGT